MLGQDATDVPDIDSISLDELVISDTTEESAVKCRNIPVPSNSPDLIEQEFYEEDSVFPENYSARPSRRNASHDVFQLNNVLYGPDLEVDETQATFDTTSSVPATDSGISVSGASDEFPYADLATIDRMVNSPGWKVPVEPGQELERLLKACLELARSEMDDENEACQKFYQDTLSNSFHKVLTDSAVNSWTPEIQGYIFDNSVLLVKLMAAKIRSENMALLRLMAIVFNPTSKFHHYNASQPSKTVPPSSQIPGADIFARPTDFRVPKGWLVDLINNFGSDEGFQNLLDQFKAFTNPSLELVSTYLKPFGLCIDLLTSSCVQNYLVPCTLIVTNYVSNLSNEQLKKETKVETRNDTLSGLIQTLKMILHRAPQDKKTLVQGVEILHLDLLLKLIKTSSFNGKMNALNELNRIITPFLFNRRQNKDSESITSEDLACWLKDQKILNVVFTDYLHLPQYVEKLDKTLKFLIHEDKLTTADIDLIWDAQIDKHEAIVKNIHDLLAKLAWVLNPDSLDAIFIRFQRSWETANTKTKEKLLELMGRLAEDDKEGVISDKVLQVLWILITGRDSSTEIIDLALSTHIKILNYIYSHDKDKQRLYWIEKCIQNIRHHHCVVASLKHLREMCKLYSESHHGYGYVHKMKQLERDNTLIQLVINDIEFYLDQTKKLPDIQTCKPTDVLPSRCYSHVDELNERLEFIRFTLKHANCYLSLTHAMQLWRHLTSHRIYKSDMDIIFRWFGELVGDDSDIEACVSRQLFVEKMLALDPATYTEPGLRCFENYFKEVNENEIRENKNNQKFSDDDSETFIGTDYIWRLVIEGREELTEYSIALLKDIYSSATVTNQFVRHNEFIKTCFTKARQCFYQYEVQQYPQLLARQTIRILHVLREYVLDNMDKSGSGVVHEGISTPSHERSWQGIPVIIIAQLLGPHDKVLENIEVLTHTNETLGTIRRNLVAHICKNDIPQTPPLLQLKVNNEELAPSLDRKALIQLDLKDRQVLTVRVITSLHISSPGSSSSSSGDLFNSPCSPIKQTKYIPWLLYVSDVAMHHKQIDLCDAVTAILNIFPTDMEIEQDITELAATQAAEMVQSVNQSPQSSQSLLPDTLESSLSSAIFLDANCGSVRYKLEIVYALLMPAVPSAKSIKFRTDFMLAGGVETVLSLLQNERFLRGADKQTRRSCLHIFAKITKFVLTTLCYGTLALFKKNAPATRAALNLQNSLTSIPNPAIERVLRNAAHHTVQNELVLKKFQDAQHAAPTLQYIQAIFRLTRRCAFGYDLLPLPIDDTCTAYSTILFEDVWLAQELMENLTICFMHQPLILEDLLVDKEFQEFIVEMILVCSSQFVRQVVSDQLYIMCVKCCVAGKSVLDVIKLLFDNLHKTEDYGDNSCFFFGLLSRILACAAHHNIIVCNSDSLLEQEVAWLKSIEHHNKFHPLNEILLKGHLQICRELVSISSLPTKLLLGSQDNGPLLLHSLLFNYLFPASKMLLDQRKFPDIEIRDDLPICQTPQTQEAAFNLIGALCKGCLENLGFVVNSTKELFYSEQNLLNSWEFPPSIHPRNPKGFVGLKNGGATCYMNAVLQQLYMIPHIRANLLSLPCVEERMEGDISPAKLHHLGVATQVQSIFCALKESKHQYYTPDGFWRAFKLWGEPVNLREQHDSLEFFNALLDNLVEGTKALRQPPFITDVLEGSFADQKICKDCPHRYTRIEPFLSISVDVRNHENLTESLDEFVKGDLLEGNNAYHCELCDKKVDTVKRLCFQRLPNILAIQLKRFGYDWERECAVKYNDYFEFPDTLSMERYTVDFLSRIEETAAHQMIETGDRQDVPTPSDHSNYRLVGVVVHSGQASGGHYYSYIKQRIQEESGLVDKWYRFDDVDVSECNVDQEGQMARLCFGGDSNDSDSPDKKPIGRAQKRWWNAYILFYERVEPTSTPEVIQSSSEVEEEEEDVRTISEAVSSLSLKYNPPAALVRQVRQENLTFFHQRALYSAEFAQYIKYVVLPNIQVYNSNNSNNNNNNSGSSETALSETSNYGCSEQIALDCLDLLASYLFQTGFLCKKTVRGRIEEWQDILLNLLQSSDVCRRWFAANYLFNTPNRFYQYLLDCPMSDVRASFAFIIVTLAKLSAPDPLLSLSELNAWTADGYSYGIDFLGPLSLHIISGCYAILNAGRIDYSKSLQQLFHVFYCFMKGGIAERQQLLKLGVHKRFMRILLEEGSSMRAQYNDTSALHNVISVLICSIDLASLRLACSGLPPDVLCPVNSFQILQRTLDHDTKQLLISDNYSYLRKLLEEPTVMELEDIVQMIKYVTWENAKASKVVLSELLYYISSVHSSDMKPYLVFLLHILLIQDSWQRKRIQLVLKGGPERDTLLDIIQRSKSHHQKRAYQCMKCLTNLLSASSLAAEIFFEDPDNKFRWEGAVNWLGVQLERRPGYHGSNSGSWGNLSNETGNDFYIERSNSAVLVHQKAEALLPNDSDGGESLSEEDSKNCAPNTSSSTQNTSSSTQNTSSSAQNTSSSTQNTSSSTQNTSSSTQNTSSSGQETTSSTPNTSIREFSIDSEENNTPGVNQGLSLESGGVSRNSLSDVETSRGSSGDCDTSIDAE
ncbi:hypothetical protein ACHWQZ_G019033 [Mnemiopsis leidyi]